MHHISNSDLPLQSHSTTMLVKGVCRMVTIQYHTQCQNKPCLGCMQ